MFNLYNYVIEMTKCIQLGCTAEWVSAREARRTPDQGVWGFYFRALAIHECLVEALKSTPPLFIQKKLVHNGSLI
jgi:hypothetical protein